MIESDMFYSEHLMDYLLQHLELCLDVSERKFGKEVHGKNAPFITMKFLSFRILRLLLWNRHTQHWKNIKKLVELVSGY